MGTLLLFPVGLVQTMNCSEALWEAPHLSGSIGQAGRKGWNTIIVKLLATFVFRRRCAYLGVGTDDFDESRITGPTPILTDRQPVPVTQSSTTRKEFILAPEPTASPHPGGAAELDGEPAFVLWQAAHVSELAQEVRLSEFGLTLPLYSALARLKQQPEASMADLARFTFTTPQNMSAAVTRLERMGYVTRRRHPNRARMVEVRLTLEGETALEEAHARVFEVQSQMVADLTAEERAALPGILRRCRDALRNH